MADAMSTYLENAVINATVRNSAYASTTVHVALFTDVGSLAELEDNDPTNEVANANGYVRQSVTFNAPSNGATFNTTAITFPAAGGIWGNIRYAAIVDDSAHNGGNILYYGQLNVDKQINTSDQFQFNIGDLDVVVS